jgi:hypothetical protein
MVLFDQKDNVIDFLDTRGGGLLRPRGAGASENTGGYCPKYRANSETFKSAKGAARTANRSRNWPAPRSVLREFLRISR